MEQLLLNLNQITVPKPTLTNYLADNNEEAFALINKIAHEKAGFPVVYIHGPQGSGCTHLLKAAGNLPHNIYIDARSDPQLNSLPLENESNYLLIAIDNVQTLSPEGEQRVFHLCNRARSGDSTLLIAGDDLPARLHLRQDLKMRFSQGITYSIIPLSDERKMVALKTHVKTRQMAISDDVLNYLLTHAGRDLGTLLHLLSVIDYQSLKLKKTPSLPFAKAVLNAYQAEDCT